MSCDFLNILGICHMTYHHTILQCHVTDVYVLLYTCSQLLMKNMQLLMTSVDSLQQDTYRLLGYEKTLAKQVQTKQQFIARRVI